MNINNKILLIAFFIFLSTYHLPAFEISLSGGTGFNITEEAHVIIGRVQYAPDFYFKASFSKNVGRSILQNHIKMNFTVWPYYMKNFLPYYTDKTLSLDVPIEYELIFKVPRNRKIAFLGGSGFLLDFRWDRYSAGNYFWYSEFRISPIPFITFGLSLDIKKVEVSFKHSIGGIVSFTYFFIKEEFFNKDYEIHPYNKFDLEIIVRIKKRYKIITGWINKLNMYLILDNWIPYSYFQNMFYVGFGYEI